MAELIDEPVQDGLPDPSTADTAGDVSVEQEDSPTRAPRLRRGARRAGRALVEMLWDRELAAEHKAQVQPKGSKDAKETPRTWKEILRDRPWARAADRIGRGALPVFGELIKMARPQGETPKAKFEHMVVVVFVVAAAASAIPTARAVTMPLLSGLFLWRAWTLGAPPTTIKLSLEEQADDALDNLQEVDGTLNDHENPGEKRHQPAVLDFDTWLLALVEYAVAADHLKRRKGVHLVDILTSAQGTGRLIDWDVKQFNRELKARGIPVSDGINIAGKGNTIGVRYDELKEHLGRPPRIPPSLVPDLTPSGDPEGTSVTGLTGPLLPPG